MNNLAIIGSGIAGLGCAHFLNDKYDITLFDENDYIGGHTNTVIVYENGEPIPIDTGFMVYNTTTYPNLTRFFDQLAVPTATTDMSFSVQHEPEEIEWCGSSLNNLYGQRKNIFSLRFHRFVLALAKFNKQAETDAAESKFKEMSLRHYLQYRKVAPDLVNLYLLPMSSAIWSTPPGQMLNFPAHTLLKFFYNHRFNAGLSGHLQWRTVVGGSREYIVRLLASTKIHTQTNCRVRKVHQKYGYVRVELWDGRTYKFDKVILATHADQALSLLENPTSDEERLLSSFPYTRSAVELHTDQSVMPQSKRCWASWNYRYSQDEGGFSASTHYWMNNLQKVSQRIQYFVSLNASARIDKSKILKRLAYTHPSFSMMSLRAQSELNNLNDQGSKQRVYFCGSYFGYGFHEDAFTSAKALCETLTRERVEQ